MTATTTERADSAPDHDELPLLPFRLQAPGGHLRFLVYETEITVPATPVRGEVVTTYLDADGRERESRLPTIGAGYETRRLESHITASSGPGPSILRLMEMYHELWRGRRQERAESARLLAAAQDEVAALRKELTEQAKNARKQK